MIWLKIRKSYIHVQCCRLHSRIANRELPDQTASPGLGLCNCLVIFNKATSVQNFRTFTIFIISMITIVKTFTCIRSNVNPLSGAFACWEILHAF